MRAAISCPRHHRCLRRRRARPWIIQQIPGAKHAPQVSPIPYSPGIPDTEFLRPRCRDHVQSIWTPTGISDTEFPGYLQYRIPASALSGSCNRSRGRNMRPGYPRYLRCTHADKWACDGPLAQNMFNTPSQRGVSPLPLHSARIPNK